METRIKLIDNKITENCKVLDELYDNFDEKIDTLTKKILLIDSKISEISFGIEEFKFRFTEMHELIKSFMSIVNRNTIQDRECFQLLSENYKRVLEDHMNTTNEKIIEFEKKLNLIKNN